MPNRKPPARTPFTSERSPTPEYYGFFDSLIARQDWKLNEGIKGTRVIEYKKANGKAKNALAVLQERGLVLGRPTETNSKEIEQVIIPNSAHPIKHDTGSSGFSSLRYNDTARFYDLGVMLGQIAHLETPFELAGVIGENIAEVEFTLQAERRLLLVPGFEHYLVPAEDGHEALLMGYAQRLNGEFGHRFVQNINSFAEGFDS